MPLETTLDVVHATSASSHGEARASSRPGPKAPRGRWRIAVGLWRVIAAVPHAVLAVLQRVRGGMASGKARRALTRRVMRQMVVVHEEETEVVLEAFCSFFFVRPPPSHSSSRCVHRPYSRPVDGAGFLVSDRRLLAAYFVCQPLRDEAAMSLGTGALPGLFLASLASTVAAAPLSSALLSRTDISKGQALLLLYRFFSLCLLGFFFLYLLVPPPATLPALPTLPDELVGEGGHAVQAAVYPDAAGQLAVFADVSLPFLAVRAGLFLFVALLNLFAIAAMWARLADVMTSEAGARLFGFIGAGATFGQLAGSLLASSLAALGPYLLILSAVLMEVAARCSTLIDDGSTLPHGMHSHPTDSPACTHGDMPEEGHGHGWCSHARPRKGKGVPLLNHTAVAVAAPSPLRPSATAPLFLSSSSSSGAHSASGCSYCSHQPLYPPTAIAAAPSPSPPLLTPAADTPSQPLLTPPVPTKADFFPSPFLPLPPPAQPSPVPPSAPCLLHARMGENEGTEKGGGGGLGACRLHERGMVGGGEEGTKGGEAMCIRLGCVSQDQEAPFEFTQMLPHAAGEEKAVEFGGPRVKGGGGGEGREEEVALQGSIRRPEEQLKAGDGWRRGGGVGEGGSGGRDDRGSQEDDCAGERRAGAVLRSAVSWPQSLAEAAAAEGRGEEGACARNGGKGQRRGGRGVGNTVGREFELERAADSVARSSGLAEDRGRDAAVTIARGNDRGAVTGGAAGAMKIERGELVWRRRGERLGGLGTGEEDGVGEMLGRGESGSGLSNVAVFRSTSGGAAVPITLDAGVSIGLAVQQKHLKGLLKGHLGGDTGVQAGGQAAREGYGLLMHSMSTQQEHVDRGQGSGKRSSLAEGAVGAAATAAAAAAEAEAALDMGNSPSKLKPRPLWQWQWVRLQALWQGTGKQERAEQGGRGACGGAADRDLRLAGNEGRGGGEESRPLRACHSLPCRTAGGAEVQRGAGGCVQGGGGKGMGDAAVCHRCMGAVRGQMGEARGAGEAVLQEEGRGEACEAMAQGWAVLAEGPGKNGLSSDGLSGLLCAHCHSQEPPVAPVPAAAAALAQRHVDWCGADSNGQSSAGNGGDMAERWYRVGGERGPGAAMPASHGGLGCRGSSAGRASSRGTRQSGGLREVVAGVRLVLSSSYLLHVCAFLMLTAVVSSFFYFERSSVVATSVVDPVQRRKAIANINSLSAVATVVFQLTLTGRLLTTFGVAAALAASPVAALIGMAAIAWHPTPLVVAGSEALRKVVTYVLTRPSREILFTVVTREEKYKAKVTIDTVVQRLGDAAAAGFFRLLGGVFLLGPSGVATYTVPPDF
ncbi:unnamed protein product [Closterium sp. NIES-64]|nr:unnamed protein product [Closterium sp. NIES-64]